MADQDEDVLQYYNRVGFPNVWELTLIMFAKDLLLELWTIFFWMALVVAVLKTFDYLVEVWYRLYLKRKRIKRLVYFYTVKKKITKAAKAVRCLFANKTKQEQSIVLANSQSKTLT